MSSYSGLTYNFTYSGYFHQELLQINKVLEKKNKYEGKRVIN